MVIWAYDTTQQQMTWKLGIWSILDGAWLLRAKCASSKKVLLVAWHFADELKKTVEMGLKEELLNIEQNSKDEVHWYNHLHLEYQFTVSFSW